jgi:hypothetical protein
MNRINTSSRASRSHQAVDLNLLLFSAKIDFISLQTPCKFPLPDTLDGRPKWPSSEHYEVLTIHDATARDLVALLAAGGDLGIRELEIAIDVRPRPGVPATQRQDLIALTMTRLFGAGLDPKPFTDKENPFRALYRPVASSVVGGFNLRLPHPRDQQLHGGREDAVQVKSYQKRVDMKKALEERHWTARVEVALRQELRELGLHSLSHLFDFGFRKRLMPFFRHVKGTARRSNRRALVQGPLRTAMDAWYERNDAELWSQAGVGAFKTGGKGKRAAVRLVADRDVNDRIGQSLGRLEKTIRAAKPVCLQHECQPQDPALARVAGPFG